MGFAWWDPGAPHPQPPHEPYHGPRILLIGRMAFEGGPTWSLPAAPEPVADDPASGEEGGGPGERGRLEGEEPPR